MIIMKIFVLVILIFCKMVYLETVVQDQDTDEDVFVPTYEWQVVKKGNYCKCRLSSC